MQYMHSEMNIWAIFLTLLKGMFLFYLFFDMDDCSFQNCKLNLALIQFNCIDSTQLCRPLVLIQIGQVANLP